MTGFLPDHPGADVRVSPNFGPRRGIGGPDIILLHYTGMESGDGAEAWLCNPASAVSSHYLVHEDGRVVQLVRESDRAWHAGSSSWRGETDVNSRSIGIEIANPGHAFGYPDFPAVQIEAVIGLCRGIIERHEVPAERVLAHSDVAPGRKIDPGEKFPWDQLHREGVGHLVQPAQVKSGENLLPGQTGGEVEELQSMLSTYGYSIEITGVYDAATKTVVEAFQRHFRQERVDGIADPSTCATLHDLLSTLSSGPFRMD